MLPPPLRVTRGLWLLESQISDLKSQISAHLGRWFAFLLAFFIAGPDGQSQTAGLSREFFGGISGNDIAALTSAPSFPDRPTFRDVLTNAFETPENQANNYGQRIRGFLNPPQTGDYVFWIASDDQSALYLSPDEDPARKRLIAGVNGATSFRYWFAEANQQSAPVRLEAGQLYYVEALMKEGGGGDHLSVRWSVPLLGIEEPMPAAHFLPFGTPLFPPEITRQPASITVTEGESAAFRIEVRNADPVSYQWQRNGTPIPGGNQATLQLTRVAAADHGARFRCTVANDLGFALSEEAVLSVLPDRTPPAIVSVFNASLSNVVVRFTEPVGTNTALLAGNYQLDPGATVSSVRVGADDAEVVLGTSPLVPGTAYTLIVNGVTDRAATPNPVAPDSRVPFIALALTPSAIGSPSFAATVQPVPGGLDIAAPGRGLAGTNDQLHFSHEARTGDFDVAVRLESLQLTTLFTQAGLLVRQSLAPGSPFAASLATPSLAGCFFTWRAGTNAVAGMQGAFPVNYPHTWLRLQRAGSNFTGYASYDGAAWSRLGTAAIAMSNTVHLGLAVGSRATNTAALAAFRDYHDVPAPPVPGAAPAPPGSFEALGPSSRRTGLVFSEIMYHAPDRDDRRQLEFVEIANTDSVFADLGGYRLSGAVDFTFPEGTRLPAGAFLVVAQAPADLEAATGLAGVLGPWNGRLPRDVGTLRLRGPTGAVFLEVEYSDEPPWPVAADGAGHSLVLARPSYGEGDARAWAASARRGGSPGAAEIILPDPWRGLVINEVLAHTDDPVVDHVELYNHGPAPVDLSGCALTDDPANPRFRIPGGITLPSGGFIAWTQTQLGFALAAAGEAVFLIGPDGGRVLDAVRFGPQMSGLPSGRTPDGAPDWQHLAAPTPGAPNAPAWTGDIVINEIMYHPPVGEIGEYLELFNRASGPVNLKDWRLVGGIDFTFTNDVVLNPGGYLAVAADAAYLRSAYLALAADRIVGNFTGNLRNSGERIALVRPEALVATNAAGRLETNRVLVIVNEVTYRDGGRWGRWSDGDGSSLELVDPRADNRLAANWADSDETAKSGWTTVEFSGLLELGQGDAGELQIMLLGAGECLVDDVQVLDQGGANLVANPGFEGGLGGWIAQGNHVASSISTNGPGRSLHLRASAGGDNSANRVKTALTGALVENGFATFRARARWLRGHPDLLFRLKGNYLETVAHLDRPSHLGTPGAPNSRRRNNAGPALWDVFHHPVVPAALEPVVVTARAHDPDGLGSLQLKFRFDPSITVRELEMRDNGQGGDAIAGDGVLSATLPGQAAGVLVAFWVEATDAAPTPARATFPADPALGQCLVRFGDAIPAGSFGAYRLWMTQRNTDTWTEREYMSNEALDGTIVVGTARAIYNGGARYRGSPFIRPNYTGPTGALCGYVWTLPSDDLFLGSDELNLDWLEQPGRDPTLQRERMSFWIGERLGVPFSHQRYIRVFVNGVRRGEVYTDSQQPNGEYVSGWFPDADNGEIFKIDDWFEFDDAVQREFNVDARLERYAGSDGQPHKTRYRWNWEKKSNRGLDDDYSPILDLVEALNLPDGDLYTQRVGQLIDLDGWLRPIATRRAVADWDGYGYNRGKNTFAYLTPGGRWNLLLWDLDFSLGGGSDGSNTGIFDANDPVMERFYRHPEFGRAYLQGISDAVRGPLANGVADTLMDANYAAFVGNGVTAAAPAPIKSWIAARRDFLARVLATQTAPWSIANPGGGDLTTDQSVITLTGSAPIDVRSIAVNGLSYPPTWITGTNWMLELPLRAGLNQLVLTGLDLRGSPVTGAGSSIQVTYTGDDERPEDFVRLTEIMYEPVDPDAEFVELHNASARTTFDLSGWQLDGLDYAFPGGTSIRPGAFLVAARSRTAFENAHGPGLPVVGEYAGRLNNAGETLRLLRPGSASQPSLSVNQVTYSPRPPWPARAAGTGGSLQVLDDRQDNRRPAHWYAVDAAGHGYAQWQFVSVTDRATASSLHLRLSLAGAGQVRLDDVSLVAGLVPRTGPEWVANGGFEEPLAPAWIADPPAAGSFIDTAERRSGQSSLRLVLSADGTPGAAALRQSLTATLAPGQFYTLSFWYLPDPLANDLTVRLETSGPSATVSAFETPVAAATPGAPSSVRASLAPIPDLWINEVFPQGVGGLGSPWIELHNAGPDPVPLSGWFLSPDPTNPGLWAFPSQASIGPGEFLLVWADGQTGTDGALHTNFRLTPGSGSVVLARTRNGVPVAVDYLHYDGLAPGRSTGSYPDGPWADRAVFETPTPGAPNDITGLPVRLAINEWMARNTATLADPADGDYDDWFELHNAGDQPVDLSGYSLTDDPADPQKTVIPAGFVLPPRGVLLVWADGEPGQNAPGRELHADFALSADGETIALFSPGGAIVDLVTFGPQERDVSEGLQPDGAVGSVVRLPSPSPGSLNFASPVDEIRFTDIRIGGAGVTLVWTSVPGRTYQVQFTDTLGAAWTDLAPPIVATGSETSLADPSALAAPARFYRVLSPAP